MNNNGFVTIAIFKGATSIILLPQPNFLLQQPNILSIQRNILLQLQNIVAVPFLTNDIVVLT